MIVSTDKTGYSVAMKTTLYVKKMKTHRMKAGKKIGREKSVEIKKDALILLKLITVHLDKGKLVFLTEMINSKAIPTL